MNTDAPTQGLLLADIRTSIDQALKQQPQEPVIIFTVKRYQLTVDEIKLIDRTVYESMRETTPGLISVTIVVDGNDAGLISVRINREV